MLGPTDVRFSDEFGLYVGCLFYTSCNRKHGTINTDFYFVEYYLPKLNKILIK